MKQPLNRRDFVATVAGGAAAAMSGAAMAQPAVSGGEPLKVVDFHNHFVGKAFTPRVGVGAPPALRTYFDEVNRKLADEDELLASIQGAGVTTRVINTPLEFIQDPDADVQPGMVERINDQLAALVVKNKGRLLGLATVDVYTGDTAAREVRRAVTELGLRGVFVASAKMDLLLDAPQARPALAVAAELGVPVFAHPITDPQLRQRLGRYGRPGTTLNRGTVNSAALVALMESGTLDELPALRIVVSTLAIGAVLLTAGFGEGRYRSDAPALLRRHFYLDTMKLNPTLIRAAVDALGADHVLAGTDWPIYKEANIAERLRAALTAIGLTGEQQRMIAAGNALQLLHAA